MVEQMPDVRKCKWLLGLLGVLVLLSFLHAAPAFAQSLADIAPENRTIDLATISAGDKNLPSGMDSISLVKKAVEDIVTREQNQNQTRTLLIRFVAIVFILILVVCVICRILIRRYGCHMIEVWQNIYYIHQVDGKKGERFSVYIG